VLIIRRTVSSVVPLPASVMADSPGADAAGIATTARAFRLVVPGFCGVLFMIDRSHIVVRG
jgi:hypothetical protein